MLRSNILAIPVVVNVAYWTSRASLDADASEGTGEDAPTHERHREQGIMRVERQAVTVQALPYLGIVVAVALLTLPCPWRGLRPIDGWIMLAIAVFLARALLRRRHEVE